MASSGTGIVGIRDEDELDERLSEPTPGVVEALGRLDGDLVVLGVAGKMGPTLAWMARRALDELGTGRRVIGVARFSDASKRDWLEKRGVETVACDLLDPDGLARLPDASSVMFMAGMKFGASGRAGLTWAQNVFLPGLACRRYRGAKIVAFSTGNVYPLSASAGPGPSEDAPPGPIGEYAMSCLGRERMFEHFSAADGTPVCLLRLNYAVEMRYGVLVDLARKVMEGRPIDLAMGFVNVIWQGDANAMALRAFDAATSPATVLNLTGPEVLSVRELAEEFGRLLGREPVFEGSEAPDALLNDGRRCLGRFGPLRLTAAEVVPMVADWVRRGGATHGKPTRFEVRDGTF